MRSILILLAIVLASCTVPQQCCDKHVTYQRTYHQPAKVIVIKKNKTKYKKRRVKVRVNKHRKTVKKQ